MSQKSSSTRKETSSFLHVRLRVAGWPTLISTCSQVCIWLLSPRGMLTVRMRPTLNPQAQRTLLVTPTRRLQGLLGTIMSTSTGIMKLYFRYYIDSLVAVCRCCEYCVTNWRKTKDSKDNKQYPHHKTIAYQRDFPQQQDVPSPMGMSNDTITLEGRWTHYLMKDLLQKRSFYPITSYFLFQLYWTQD